jgi:hypothetical protein
VWPVRERKVSCLTTQRSEPLKVDRTAAGSCDVAIIIRVGLTDRRWAKQTDGNDNVTTYDGFLLPSQSSPAHNRRRDGETVLPCRRRG